MIHGLIAIIAIIALCLVALLWYGIRTHKTVQQLQNKVKTELDAHLAAMKAESAQAAEAAKDKLG